MSKPNPIMQSIADALRAGPRSVGELTIECRATVTPIRRHLDFLHSIRAVHVAEYRRISGGGYPSAIYAWGDGEDADNPDNRAKQIKAEAAALPPMVRLGAWGCVW